MSNYILSFVQAEQYQEGEKHCFLENAKKRKGVIASHAWSKGEAFQGNGKGKYFQEIIRF